MTITGLINALVDLKIELALANRDSYAEWDDHRAELKKKIISVNVQLTKELEGINESQQATNEQSQKESKLPTVKNKG